MASAERKAIDYRTPRGKFVLSSPLLVVAVALGAAATGVAIWATSAKERVNSRQILAQLDQAKAEVNDLRQARAALEKETTELRKQLEEVSGELAKFKQDLDQPSVAASGSVAATRSFAEWGVALPDIPTRERAREIKNMYRPKAYVFQSRGTAFQVAFSFDTEGGAQRFAARVRSAFPHSFVFKLQSHAATCTQAADILVCDRPTTPSRP